MRWSVMRFALIAATIGAGFAGGAIGQQYEEIVVTGSRIPFEDVPIPHVTIKRRADFAVFEVEVHSDTRAEAQRLDEIRQALRGMQQRSRADTVTLALYDDEIMRPFSLEAAEPLFRRGGRVDTSVITVHLRTPVRTDDTLETIRARVEQFVRSAPKPGRVEMSVDLEELALSMLNPSRFRADLLGAIAQDARAVSAGLGAGYAPRIGGLENEVAWRRTSDLELTLFIPYTLEAAPQQ